MRQDIYLYNDAGSWSVVTGHAVARIVADYREHDEQFVFAHEAALFNLEGDDYSTIRVVANDVLTDVEADEWVARARWRLKVNDAKVLICGGFDPDCLSSWLEEVDGKDIKSIELPSGDYQLTLYTYLHSMNGAVWLSGDLGETPLPILSEWFRQDHPNTSIPSWIAAMFAYEDVEESDEWYPIREKIKSGQIKIETQPLHWIGYLIHLIPFISDMELDRPEQDGWFDAQTGLRVPDRCPLGIPTDCTEDNDIVSKLDWVLGRS